MTTFTARSSCVPSALVYALGEDYDTVCRRIEKTGADYQAVPVSIVQQLLKAKFAIKKIVSFIKKRPLLKNWAKNKKGLWVAMTTDSATEHRSTHCVTVRDGEIFGNSYTHGPYAPLKVRYGWQLQKA